ncbi:MAG: hypothetical protein NTW28_21385, partial [Candidatus Solibacter sp.]|nr:hypothetical protein [Candidatus Solibacter sp.]
WKHPGPIEAAPNLDSEANRLGFLGWKHPGPKQPARGSVLYSGRREEALLLPVGFELPRRRPHDAQKLACFNYLRAVCARIAGTLSVNIPG